MEDGAKLGIRDVRGVDPVTFALDTAASDIPDATRRRAALLLLDTVGVCIAATKIEAGAIARDAAVRLSRRAGIHRRIAGTFSAGGMLRAGSF